MCGIGGFTRFEEPVGDEALLRKMGDAIAHRGPDAEGVYLDDNIGLCHRRLAIIDLSKAGNQPMYSQDNNLVMVFNGEIYNFLELREELEKSGYLFRTKTDSEVILALYEREGEACLTRLNGMFAIAIWDRRKRELFLARDRLGKKPLYYYYDDRSLVFASELKAILQVRSIPVEVRDDAVRDFFAYQFVPDTKAIFKNFYKLAAGHYLKMSQKGIRTVQYWDVSFQPMTDKPEEIICEELLELLSISTKQRMISDVPLGAFLSGGVDSSGIVALMADHSREPITTCSIGFDAEEFDEVGYARQIARRYNTNHFETIVAENLISNLSSIARYFDEPFADQSLVPTYFVSKMARQRVTVALAGDGGDENFAGYEKYRVDQIENRVRSAIPPILRNSMGRFASALGRSRLRPLNRAATLFNAVSCSEAEAFYRSNAFMSDELWNHLVSDDFRRRLGDYLPSKIMTDYYNAADAEDHLSRILYTDIKTYLLGDILVKVDRMSMANSLEVRAPILDYRVVEYAASIPARMKIRTGEKKYILKQAFDSLLPDEILYRKKMGFSVPLASWLRRELKSTCESLLFNPDGGLHQYLNPKEMKSIWEDHQSCRRDYSSTIWSLLMFELWWQAYVV